MMSGSANAEQDFSWVLGVCLVGYWRLLTLPRVVLLGDGLGPPGDGSYAS